LGQRKVISFKKLIEAVAESCKYHQYEVEDVLAHLSKVLQKMLSEGESVRLTGVGKLKMQKLKIPEKLGYNSFRLSIIQDNYMKEYLKEHYVEPTEPTTK
jgi:transcriptional regulator NrdR family protein